MLAAIYGAIYSAQRLVRPVQDLIAGTRAVGKGDFGTRLPLPARPGARPMARRATTNAGVPRASRA